MPEPFFRENSPSFYRWSKKAMIGAALFIVGGAASSEALSRIGLLATCVILYFVSAYLRSSSNNYNSNNRIRYELNKETKAENISIGLCLILSFISFFWQVFSFMVNLTSMFID